MPLGVDTVSHADVAKKPVNDDLDAESIGRNGLARGIGTIHRVIPIVSFFRQHTHAGVVRNDVVSFRRFCSASASLLVEIADVELPASEQEVVFWETRTNMRPTQ